VLRDGCRAPTEVRRVADKVFLAKRKYFTVDEWSPAWS
jgi:hypothetical protein